MVCLFFSRRPRMLTRAAAALNRRKFSRVFGVGNFFYNFLLCFSLIFRLLLCFLHLLRVSLSLLLISTRNTLYSFLMKSLNFSLNLFAHCFQASRPYVSVFRSSERSEEWFFLLNFFRFCLKPFSLSYTWTCRTSNIVRGPG